MYALEHEVPGISTLAGDPEEVSRGLHQVDAEQVVAVALAHATPREAAAIAQTFASIAELVKTLVGKHHRASLEAIVGALVPKVPPTPNELREATMLARARTAVIDSGDWMTAAEIASAAGFSASNPSAQPTSGSATASLSPSAATALTISPVIDSTRRPATGHARRWRKPSSPLATRKTVGVCRIGACRRTASCAENVRAACSPPTPAA